MIQDQKLLETPFISVIDKVPVSWKETRMDVPEGFTEHDRKSPLTD